MMNNSNNENNQTLEKLMQQGNRPVISKQRMNANRWELKRELRKESSKQNINSGSLITQFFSYRYQLASMLLTFTLGYYIAINNQAIQSNQPQIANNSAYRSGELERDYFKLSGDITDATRLELVNILSRHLKDEKVKESLSHSLLNDPNPGVRMKAAESLASLSSSPNIRKILRRSLLNDSNEGVRISVFNGLIQYLDDTDTLEFLKNQSVIDSNGYIRKKASELIEPKSQKTIQSNI